jgi:hypothetical protein
VGGHAAVPGKKRTRAASTAAKQKELDEFLKGKPELAFEKSAQEVRALAKGDRFVVTCAQNNTSIPKQKLDAVKRYCDENEATLLIVPTRYRNPTGWNSEEDYWWPKEILPYLCDSEVPLHPKLKVMGHVRVQATAVNPLSGFQPMSQGSSCIIGHSQVAMQTVATPQAELPVILHSTGSLSRKNYSTTRAGARAEFHHTPGFVVVEKQGKYFHQRHVAMQENGAFFDLNRYYSAKESKHNIRVEGLITGDSHALWHSEVVRQATFDDENSISNVLRPKVRVIHDVLDGYSISHHHHRNAFTQYAKHEWGLQRIEDELNATREFIDGTTPDDCTNVVVASNHNEHFARWLKEVDISKEPWNAKLYHEMMSAVLGEVRMTERQTQYPDPFSLWCKGKMETKTMFPGRDEPVLIKGILITMHGDVGPNGRWGSRPVLADIGVRSVIGHSHSPGITRGCYQVGTSTYLSLEYTKGPSSWMNTHCIIHPNGKRQLINILPDATWNAAPWLMAA